MTNQDRKIINMKSTSAKVFSLIAIAAVLPIALNSTLSTSTGIANSGPTFVDPTATVSGNVHMGHLVFVAPFAEIRAGGTPDRAISIGNETNIQDNCVVTAEGGAVRLGDLVIIAHGATVKGPASIGVTGRCPDGQSCPSFVGFNAEVDGAIIEKDAGVSALARVGPGVTIPSGYMVLEGKNVTSNAEVKEKTIAITPDDHRFMKNVLEVNVAFARQYAALAGQAASNVRGINLNPATPPFNPQSELPMLHGHRVREAGFRDRIIGDLHMVDGLEQLQRVMASRTSLRADEGEPFDVGAIAEMKDRVIFHALEHTHLRLGRNGHYGRACLIHGGPTPFDDYTITGDNFELGDLSVFYRSRIGADSRIGAKSLVQECDLPDRTVIPDHTVKIKNETRRVEW